MDLFKNTAIYQSQAHSESRLLKSEKRKQKLVEVGCWRKREEEDTPGSQDRKQKEKQTNSFG